MLPPHNLVRLLLPEVIFCSHFAVLQSRPEASFPSILSIATAGDHSCELPRHPVTPLTRISSQDSGRDASRENLEAAVFGILHMFSALVTSHASPLVHQA
jgi:hypothetical protein